MWLQEVLRKLHSRLKRLAKTAEDFRQLASPDWAPRIGAYINAAHWMAHSLQEAAGPLLLLDLEGVAHASMPRMRFDGKLSCTESWEEPSQPES